MANEKKRIGDIAKPVIAPGPFGENVHVYSLSKTDALFEMGDFEVKACEMLEGENGEYMHILAAPVRGIGPEGETGDIVVSTGARAIVGKLEQVGKNDFPVVARFVRGKGRGSNIWYDIE